MHQFTERPEDVFAVVVRFFDPRLQKQMDVIGHHARGEEFVALIVEMLKSLEDDGARLWG